MVTAGRAKFCRPRRDVEEQAKLIATVYVCMPVSTYFTTLMSEIDKVDFDFCLEFTWKHEIPRHHSATRLLLYLINQSVVNSGNSKEARQDKKHGNRRSNTTTRWTPNSDSYRRESPRSDESGAFRTFTHHPYIFCDFWMRERKGSQESGLTIPGDRRYIRQLWRFILGRHCLA